MALKVYNSLTRKKQEFVSLHPHEVRMYVCGITPYDLCHIGHARAALVFEVIRKYLEFIGYNVTLVRNFTDIDDKIINRALSSNISWREVADRFIGEYYRDMKALGLAEATIEPKATDHISDMIQMLKALEAKGFAYAQGGDVFFEVRKFLGYGKLSRRNIDEMLSGARVEVDSRKKDPLDFALWKRSKEGEPAWESPWGPGRPGWHIECSVMAMKYLGETIDIHGGGADLVFPHHENEIAQSEAYTGREFARYWIHNGFVNMDSEKMSKSLGNYFTIRDILDKYDADALKLFLLSTHYRAPVDFSHHKLKEAEKALDRAEITLEKAEGISDLEKNNLEARSPHPLMEEFRKGEENFMEAMDDDFHTPRAIASLFEMIRGINGLMEKGFASPSLAQAAKRIRDLAGILGLMGKGRNVYYMGKEEVREISQEEYRGARESAEAASLKGEIPATGDLRKLLLWRGLARRRGDWGTSDEIRDWLKRAGVSVEDAREGIYWKFDGR